MMFTVFNTENHLFLLSKNSNLKLFNFEAENIMRIAILFFLSKHNHKTSLYSKLISSLHRSHSWGFESVSRPIFTLFDLSYKRCRYCSMKKRFCIYGYKVVAYPCSFVVWKLIRSEALKGTMACCCCLGFVVWLCSKWNVLYVYVTHTEWDVVMLSLDVHMSVHGCKMVGCGRLGL